MLPFIVPLIRSIPVTCRYGIGNARWIRLPLELKHPSGHQLRAAVIFRLYQIRSQSTSNKPEFRPSPARPRRVPLRDLLSLALRSLRTLSFRNIRLIYRRDPWVVISAGIVITMLVGLTGYVIYAIKTYFYAPHFTRYPPEIAMSLRKALYYTNINPQPDQALKWYKKAMDQCRELELDPYSDEVIGLRIQIAHWLEKIHQYKQSIITLEALLADIARWLDYVEKAAVDGTLPQSEQPVVVYPNSKGAESELPNGQEAVIETVRQKRTRLLAKSVGISIKLGELYSDEHVLEQDKALVHLTWAVETALSESARRATKESKEAEGVWMSPEEIGGALEALALNYEKTSQFHLAVPLLFQALRQCNEPCHRAVIMNNLAVAFAQHPLYIPVQIPPAPSKTPAESGVPVTRAQFLEAGRNWARNAQAHANGVENDKKTAECDQACAVALSNLGDIAAMMGDKEEARRRFDECIAMSKRLGFSQGVAQAQAGLRKLVGTAT